MSKACPVCGRPATRAHQPFCDRGCRDRDLLRWLDEGYRIPGAFADPETDDQPRDMPLDKGDRPD